MSGGRRAPPQPHHSVYASAGRVCERRMLYTLTAAPAQLPQFVAPSNRRFERDFSGSLNTGRLLVTYPSSQLTGSRDFRIRSTVMDENTTGSRCDLSTCELDSLE